MSPLYEKHRPHTLNDVVGQDKSVATIRRLFQRGIGGRPFSISGVSRIGKTTLARIIAAEIADDWFVTEYDSADDVNAHEINRIRDSMHLTAMGRGGRCWVINESHGLKRPIIRRLLGILERLPSHCVIVFTTTRDGGESLFEEDIDANPLLSRCIPMKLSNQRLTEPFAARTKEIAVAEGLDGRPVAAYVKLARRCHNNMRAILHERLPNATAHSTGGSATGRTTGRASTATHTRRFWRRRG